MPNNEDILNNIVSGDDIKTILRHRRQKHNYITITKGKEENYIQEGWEISKKNKKSFRLNKPKPIGETLEDELWCIFARMGFLELNADNQFKVPLDLKENSVPPKQIDVYAKDDETVILVECKAAENPRKRSFQKDINEIQGIKGKVITSIRKHYGRDKKLKVGWIFATRNIKWSKPDIERAKDANILVLTDQNIDYYKNLTNHIGKAAKYQLMADLFGKQKIPELEIIVPAIKGRIGDIEFYTFNIEPSKLLKIAFISHRAKMDRDTVASYQRMLKKGRLKSIRKYIDEGGIFSTSIVINLYSGKRNLQFDPITHKKDAHGILGKLHLPGRYKSAWIIDGQHRLYGFSDSDYSEKVTLPVIAFENLDIITQANMFVDINSKQVRVPPNHLTDLYSDLFWGSPDDEKNLFALISRIVRYLGNDIRSPLKDRITPLSGRQTSKYNQPITIKSLYDAIFKPRLIGRIGKGGILIHGPLYTINNEETLERGLNVISDYLNLFKNKFPEHWELGSQSGGYLCTNGGITALLIVLKSISDYVPRQCGMECIDMSDEDLMKEITILTKPIIGWFNKATQEEILQYRIQRGSAGHINCAYGMMEKIHNIYEDFNPSGLQDYIKRSSSASNEEARSLTYNIQKMISEHVLDTMKEKYGYENEKWWYDGIPETVRTEIVARRERDHEHSSKESYFMLINYRDIALKNWDIFQNTLSLGNKAAKRNVLNWFVKLNNIRNKVSHPERGLATVEEVEFLKTIKQKLEEVLLE